MKKNFFQSLNSIDDRCPTEGSSGTRRCPTEGSSGTR
jgi:hypothetical protein